MQQIADWLEKLGMSEYAERFAENRIDFSILRDLTDQDLKDLGVVKEDRSRRTGIQPTPIPVMLNYRSSPQGKPMRRREFIAVIGSATVTWPLASIAQEVEYVTTFRPEYVAAVQHRIWS